jgi:alpha-tubulin suppressor-like RCC1 family protein
MGIACCAGPLPFLLVLAALGLACGDTLVDHRATDLLEQPAICGTGSAYCSVEGTLTCVADSPEQCGDACADCTATVALPGAGTEAACLPPASGEGPGTCGWQCTGGFLKCGGGCCAATQLAAGDAHTCAITSKGSLVCWGLNDWGQATHDSSSQTSAPREVFPSGVTAVAAGALHTCAVVDGAVRCWGWNSDGQAPDVVPEAAGATALAAGQLHTCAIVGNGKVVCWGSRLAGRTGGETDTPVASGATALVAGWNHSCALVGSEVRCWGSNGEGQLAQPTTVPSSDTALRVDLPSGSTSLAAGRFHACAATGLDSPGAVLCWGAAPGTAYGLGVPQRTPAVPRRPDGTQETIRYPVSRVTAGRTHTCVAKDGDGTIECFGPENADGQLGGTPAGEGEAVGITNSTGAKGVAAGADHACAISADGGVRCWGRNANGQLGNARTENPGTGVLVEVIGR